MSGFRSLYKEHKFVKLATAITTVGTAVTLVVGAGVKAAEFVDDRYAKVADVQSLQHSQTQIQREQQEQRSLLERQSKQLEFIYYDSMKREQANIEKEIFELRRKAELSGDERANLRQLLDDLAEIKQRIHQSELTIRGQ